MISPVLLWTIAIAVLIPSTVFCIECLANIWAPGLDEEGTNDFSTSFNILIPAHNEAEKISLTLQGLISEVCETDRIVVIADNCTDATAKIARAHGVTVFERDNSSQLGKGYALDFALEQLQMHPPEVVIVVDADCQVSPGTVALLAAQAHLQQRPIQVTYSMELGEQGTITDRISAFAIKVRNVVRSIGMARLGYPCVLAGSGMAFPWDILQKVSLAGSKCVDDMQLTIDLAIAGHTPTYTTAGQVTGRLMQNQAAQSQRSRWEHGHLEVIFTQVPKLLWEGWRQQRFDLVMLALDLSVPPLSLLVLLWLLAFSLSGLFWVLGWVSWFPLAVLALAGSLLSLGLSVAWVKVGRQDLPMLTLFSIPIYLFWKLPIYLKFFVRPQTRWLKTERDIEPETSKQ
ncbi:glycosyltransferase family 2 protein [Acaryochloris sp. IP29b_bin.137]|uniref:glycosyltransferase family 2 protein n=1 Tax=Acaryochloris sp. IP29b_bin.137 TaxID=2969217 RepID=UPI002622A75B|nr:glycosyltransferase family 2 protein [Acaryochloris sp. IP29b_bin.137]